MAWDQPHVGNSNTRTHTHATGQLWNERFSVIHLYFLLWIASLQTQGVYESIHLEQKWTWFRNSLTVLDQRMRALPLVFSPHLPQYRKPQQQQYAPRVSNGSPQISGREGVVGAEEAGDRASHYYSVAGHAGRWITVINVSSVPPEFWIMRGRLDSNYWTTTSW